MTGLCMRGRPWDCSAVCVRRCREITHCADSSEHSPSLAHLLFGSRSPLGRGWSLLLDPSLALTQLRQALPHADGHLRAQTPDKYAARVEAWHWWGRDGLQGSTPLIPTSHESARQSRPPSTPRSGPTKKYPFSDLLPRDTMRVAQRRICLREVSFCSPVPRHRDEMFAIITKFHASDNLCKE